MKKSLFFLFILFSLSNVFSGGIKSAPDNYEHHLYFPLAFNDSNYTSYIGILNFTSSQANYIIHIYNQKGEKLVVDKSGTIAPGERIYTKITDTELSEPCWVMVSSDYFLAGYMNTISKDLTESYFYLPDTSLSTSIYVPHIAPETNYWYSYTSLINGDATEIASPFFDYFAGAIRLSSPVNPLEQNYFEWFNDIFNQSLPLGMKGWGRIYTNDLATLSGMETFKFKVDGYFNIAGLSLPSELTDTLYFPHIHVEGGYWWTGIAVNNASEISIPVTFHAIDSDGNELDTVTWIIDPYDKLVKLAQNLWTDKNKEFPQNTAWIKATSTERKIIGYELFGTLESKGRRLLAGLNCPVEGYKILVFPHVESNIDFWTGIAFVNISDQSATITVTAYNNEGKNLGSVQISDSFKPNQKYVSTVKDLFGGNVPEGTTYIKVSSSEKIVGFELWGNLNPQQDYISGMLAIPYNYVVFKEGFETDTVINDGIWTVVRAKDNQYSSSGWQTATKLPTGLGSWAELYEQTPPEGKNYVVGYFGKTDAVNHQYLVSPQIELPSTISTLSYYYQFGWPETATNSCYVYITEDLDMSDGIDFTKTTLLKEYTPSFMASLERSIDYADFTVWQKEYIDISQFAGKKIRLVFEIKAQYEESFHIDKIEVK